MKETEENHMERTHQLADFEETFKVNLVNNSKSIRICYIYRNGKMNRLLLSGTVSERRKGSH